MKTAKASSSAVAPMANDRIRCRCTSVRDGKNSSTRAASAGTQTMALRSSVGSAAGVAVGCGGGPEGGHRGSKRRGPGSTRPARIDDPGNGRPQHGRDGDHAGRHEMRVGKGYAGEGDKADRIDSAAEGTNPGDHADDRQQGHGEREAAAHVTYPLRLEAAPPG